MLDFKIKILKQYEQKIQEETITEASLLGLEGSASRVYFPQIFSNINWHGRRPRTKCDYVNTTLDIGYSMLFNMVDSMLQIYGFDVYCGVYHKEYYMRKSLACLAHVLRYLQDAVDNEPDLTWHKRMKEFLSGIIHEAKTNNRIFSEDRITEIDYTNNLSERCLRKLKRKFKQAVTFRSDKSIEHLCNCFSEPLRFRATVQLLFSVLVV